MNSVFRLSLCGICLFSALFLNGQTHHLKLNNSSGIFTPEEIAGNNFVVSNPYPNPEPQWVDGVEGNALRFNGYATKLEGNLTNEIPNDQLTISLWFALEAYAVESSGLIARHTEGENRGWYASINRFGILSIGVFINGVSNTFVSNEPISRFDWHHLAFTINTTEQQIEVFLDGNSIGTKTTNSGVIEYPSGNVLKLGQHIQTTTIGIYETHLFNGILDEIKIFDSILSTIEIEGLATEYSPTPPDFNDTEQRFEGDFHRPRYHAQPPANWTNEPHGLIYYNDTYHIFYQKNANGAYIRQQNWGHQTSPDLVKWVEQPPALTPSPNSPDQDGCWAGLAIEDDLGQMQLIYTGVDGSAQIMLATANEDATEFTKYSGNPLVQTPPAPYTAFDFRDPFVWKENGFWYMIIGTGLNGTGNSGGAVLMYKSSNLTDWDYIDVMYKGFPDSDGSGVFWELPVFWKFGDKYVLIVIPIPQPNDPAKMLYWTGTFEDDVFTPDDMMPKQLGTLNGMLSPTLCYDENGDVVGMTIVPDLLPAEEQRENGWQHLYSIPRIFTLTEDGILAQRPHPNLTKLRDQHYHFENLEVGDNQSGFLENIHGRQLEIRATIEKNDAFRAGIIIAQNEGNTERTEIYQDWLFGFNQMDRSQSSGNPAAPNSSLGFPLNLPEDEDLDLHIFYDGSVVEVFINEKESYSGRIFPNDESSTGLDLFAEGGTAIFKTLDIWELIDKELVATSEPPKPQNATNYIQKVFPNPTDSQLIIQVNLPNSGNLTCSIYDLWGRKMMVQELNTMGVGQQEVTIDVGSLKSDANIYFLELQLNQQLLGVQRFFKK